MEKTEHAQRLRLAMAQAGMSSESLAVTLGVSPRTIVNWISKKQPTLPNDTMQANLRRILPGYDAAGDPVELAINQAELAPFRRAALVAEYARHVHEQALEDARVAQSG